MKRCTSQWHPGVSFAITGRDLLQFFVCRDVITEANPADGGEEAVAVGCLEAMVHCEKGC
jgi:hypothetical protein